MAKIEDGDVVAIALDDAHVPDDGCTWLAVAGDLEPPAPPAENQRYAGTTYSVGADTVTVEHHFEVYAAPGLDPLGVALTSLVCDGELDLAAAARALCLPEQALIDEANGWAYFAAVAE